mgnify:CR=1 FL=1
MVSASIQKQTEAIVAVVVVNALQVKSVVKVAVLQNAQAKPIRCALVDVSKSRRLVNTVVPVEMPAVKEKSASKVSVVVLKEKPAVKKRVLTPPKIPTTVEAVAYAAIAACYVQKTSQAKSNVPRAVPKQLQTLATVVVSTTRQILKTAVDVVKPVLRNNRVKKVSAYVRMERTSVAEAVSILKKTISTVANAEIAALKVNNASKVNANWFALSPIAMVNA